MHQRLKLVLQRGRHQNGRIALLLRFNTLYWGDKRARFVEVAGELGLIVLCRLNVRDIALSLSAHPSHVKRGVALLYKSSHREIASLVYRQLLT